MVVSRTPVKNGTVVLAEDEAVKDEAVKDEAVKDEAVEPSDSKKEKTSEVVPLT